MKEFMRTTSRGYMAPSSWFSASATDISSQRAQNFDLIRLFAAISVVFSHSFAIANGSEQGEPLVLILGTGNIVGIYGVYSFFIISGYLIAASFERSSLIEYFIKRSMRIFPGLIVCLATTTTIAMLVTSGGAEGGRALCGYVIALA